jgi:TIR domain
MAQEVFISFASPNEQAAFKVCTFLEKHGISCWIAPRDQVPGLSYPDAIIKAIKASRVLVLIFSSDANKSENVLNEIVGASKQNMPIIPICLEDVAFSDSLQFFIGKTHWIDAGEGRFPGAMKELVRAVQVHLKPEGSSPIAAGVRPGKQLPFRFVIGAIAVITIIGLTLIYWGKVSLNRRISGSEASRQSPPNEQAGSSWQDDKTMTQRQKTPRSDCYSIVAKTPEVFPFSLANSPATLFSWFHIRVENHCSHPLYLEVTFKTRRGPALVTDEPILLTVYPGQCLDKNGEPGFQFLKDDIDDILEVNWKIRNDRGDILDQGTRSIRVQPKNVYKFNLTNATGEPLPKEFLLAELCAWAQANDAAVRKRSELLKDFEFRGNPKNLANAWMERCYNSLFSAKSGVRILPSRGPFPPADSRIISTPDQIMEKSMADPLEGILFFCALSKKASQTLGMRMALLITADGSETPNHQRYLLAWSTEPGVWQALDFTRAGALNFIENVKIATGQLYQVIEKKPELLASLDRSGVFLEKQPSLVSIDFPRAAKYYHIKGLP